MELQAREVFPENAPANSIMPVACFVYSKEDCIDHYNSEKQKNTEYMILLSAQLDNCKKRFNAIENILVELGQPKTTDNISSSQIPLSDAQQPGIFHTPEKSGSGQTTPTGNVSSSLQIPLSDVPHATKISYATKRKRLPQAMTIVDVSSSQTLLSDVQPFTHLYKRKKPRCGNCHNPGHYMCGRCKQCKRNCRCY